MTATVRPAEASDLPVLERLYRMLEEEMTGLHEMWPLADGLPEPVAASLAAALADDDTLVLLGSYESFPFGFLLARLEPLLPQADGERIGSIRLVFVDPEAREVGVGEALREEAVARMRARGARRFDAHVLPGHRLAKNFFEAGGFSARAIVMHNRGG
jgi:ribosomal protein S18 acetylase RimI-like enzyme